MIKVLIRKKKNSDPDTEFEIQNYFMMNKNGLLYKKTEKEIIKDINNKVIYRTLNDNHSFTEVVVEGKVEIINNNIIDNRYLSSVNNETKVDNITNLEEYE